MLSAFCYTCTKPNDTSKWILHLYAIDFAFVVLYGKQQQQPPLNFQNAIFQNNLFSINYISIRSSSGAHAKCAIYDAGAPCVVTCTCICVTNKLITPIDDFFF